jgi:hypothetical protein
MTPAIALTLYHAAQAALVAGPVLCWLYQMAEHFQRSAQ